MGDTPVIVRSAFDQWSVNQNYNGVFYPRVIAWHLPGAGSDLVRAGLRTGSSAERLAKLSTSRLRIARILHAGIAQHADCPIAAGSACRVVSGHVSCRLVVYGSLEGGAVEW